MFKNILNRKVLTTGISATGILVAASSTTSILPPYYDFYKRKSENQSRGEIKKTRL